MQRISVGSAADGGETTMSRLNKFTGGTSFVGRDAVDLFSDIAVLTALRLYERTKMQVNRNYTPGNMLKYVSRRTGQVFKRGAYSEAIRALDAYISEQRKNITVDVT